MNSIVAKLEAFKNDVHIPYRDPSDFCMFTYKFTIILQLNVDR